MDYYDYRSKHQGYLRTEKKNSSVKWDIIKGKILRHLCTLSLGFSVNIKKEAPGFFFFIK